MLNKFFTDSRHYDQSPTKVSEKISTSTLSIRFLFRNRLVRPSVNSRGMNVLGGVNHRSMIDPDGVNLSIPRGYRKYFYNLRAIVVSYQNKITSGLQRILVSFH